MRNFQLPREHLSGHVTMNIAQCLKPLLIWFRFNFGIGLDRSNKHFTGGNFIVLCFVFWFICITFPLSVFHVHIGAVGNDSSCSNSSVYNFNFKISWILPGVIGSIFHVSILVVTLKKWESLWKSLQQLQDAIGDEPEFFRNLRRCSLKGLLILFMVCYHEYVTITITDMIWNLLKTP